MIRNTREVVLPRVILRIDSYSAAPKASRNARVTAGIFSCGIAESSLENGVRTVGSTDKADLLCVADAEDARFSVETSDRDYC
jgi:hypothetical protein